MAKRSLHPDFPVVSGRYQMTKEWSCVLPEEFNRRFEDDSLVIWRPGLTFWILVWGNDNGQTIEDRMRRIIDDASPARTDERIVSDAVVSRLMYRLAGDHEQPDVLSLSAFAFSNTGHVQLAAYIDDEKDVDIAESVVESLEFKT
ncbi:MAG: hypothetical protein KDB68_04940 [Planctomycetes bacterium]|nr:hypothetical protein [Planctomycetota bacterium]